MTRKLGETFHREWIKLQTSTWTIHRGPSPTSIAKRQLRGVTLEELIVSVRRKESVGLAGSLGPPVGAVEPAPTTFCLAQPPVVLTSAISNTPSPSHPFATVSDCCFSGNIKITLLISVEASPSTSVGQRRTPYTYLSANAPAMQGSNLFPALSALSLAINYIILLSPARLDTGQKPLSYYSSVYDPCWVLFALVSK